MEKWKHRVKKIAAILLALTLILGAVDLSAFPVNAAESYGALIEAGDTGDCQWAVYDSNADSTGDLLVISGEGPMGGRIYNPDSMEWDPAPWNKFSETLETVLIGEGVTSIGNEAFKGLSSVSDITLPESLTDLGVGVFQECGPISIEIPKGIVNLRFNMFSHSGLTSIKLPEGLVSIERSVFYGCENLKAIELPQSLRDIGEFAFSECSSLSTIKVPEGVTEINNYTFANCTNLVSVDLPESLTSIGDGAFVECKNLPSIKIPKGVTRIHEQYGNTFGACLNLKSIELPDNITSIGTNEFTGCGQLTSIKIPKSVTSIEEQAFANCRSLTSIELPDSVKSIGVMAFYHCTGLQSIKLSENLEVIEGQAFEGCDNLKIIEIPKSVREINGHEFDVSQIQTLVFYGMKNPITYNQISGPEDMSVYAPKEGTGYEKLRQGNKVIPITRYSLDISTQPTSQNVAFGENVRFSVAAEGSVGEENKPLSYQWQRQTSDGNWQDILNANSELYEIESVMAADCGKYRCNMTMDVPEIPLTYSNFSEEVDLVVDKATPYIVEAPAAAAITYGQKISDSVLSGGKVQYSSDNSVEGFDTPIEGIFVWSNEEKEKRPTTVVDSDQTEYHVIFQPTDSINYHTVETTVRLTVNKAPSAPGIPKETMNVSQDCIKVNDVSLPEGWNWQSSDAEKQLESGIPLVVTAVYNGTDKGNYEIESVEITVTRSGCSHKGGTATCTIYAVCDLCGQEYGSLDNNNHIQTEVINVEEATCTKDGYTGDTCCTGCKEVVTQGNIIIATGHKGGIATCAHRAVCDVCGQEYGFLDNSHKHFEIRDHKIATCTEDGYTGDTYCVDCGNKTAIGKVITMKGHGDTELKDKKEATCTKDGYTGDVYCIDCGDKTVIGTVIPAKGHVYTNKVIKEPTCTQTGETEYRCFCGEHYTESVSALNHDKTEIRGEIAATCTEKGYSGDKYCSICEMKISSGTAVPAHGHLYNRFSYKKATRFQEGKDTVRCYYCADIKVKIIPRPAAPKVGTIVKNASACFKVTKSDDTKGTLQCVKARTINDINIVIPDYIDIDGAKYKVTSIAANAFKNSDLRKIVLSDSVTTIGSNAFSGCKKLYTATMGKKLKTIGKNAFSGCSTLKTLNMGKNVTTINEKAFYQCTALTKITIPEKVNKIGKQALQGCKKLKTISVKTTKLTNKNVGAKAFMGIHAKATIKVPKSKVKTYRKLLKTKGIGSKVKVCK